MRDSYRQGFYERNLDRIFGTTAELSRQAQEMQAEGNTEQIEALLTNPRISGYGLTSLQDVAWEFHAGIVDLWRRPKLAYYAATRVNQPHLLVLRADREAVFPGEQAAVQVTLVNERQREGEVRVSIGACDPSGREIARLEEQAPASKGIHPLPDIRFTAGDHVGVYTITAELTCNDQVLAEARERVYGVEPVDWNSLPVGLRLFGQSALPAAGRAEQNGSPTVQAALLPGTLSEADWEAFFEAVEAGSPGVIGALTPTDATALAALLRHGLAVTLHMGVGSWLGYYHWISRDEVFTGLPSGGLFGKPYVEILPKYVRNELGGDVLAGTFSNTQARREPPMAVWFSDIEIVPYGKGKILLCQYRVFDRLESHPVAARLGWNALVRPNPHI
jgi:hypothetical protein